MANAETGAGSRPRNAGLKCALGLHRGAVGDALVELARAGSTRGHFKANLLPGAYGGILPRSGPAARRPALRAHAGNGIVFGHWNARLTKEQAATMLTTWRTLRRGQGSVIVPAARATGNRRSTSGDRPATTPG